MNLIIWQLYKTLKTFASQDSALNYDSNDWLNPLPIKGKHLLRHSFQFKKKIQIWSQKVAKRSSISTFHELNSLYLEITITTKSFQSQNQEIKTLLTGFVKSSVLVKQLLFWKAITGEAGVLPSIHQQRDRSTPW